MRRWGVSEDRLPPQGSIRYREPTLWESYKWRIVGVFSLCVTQTVLIATLIVERIRRRRAERERHKADETLQHLAGRLLLLQDEERRRVAGELHDGLGQSLAIIKNRVTMCQRATSNPEQVKEQLDEISATATSAIEEVREIAQNLRPYELDRLGLIAAVGIHDRTRRRIDLDQHSTDLERIDGLLSQEAETSVYRIVQEGLNNVVKHSNATTARVEIRRDRGAAGHHRPGQWAWHFAVSRGTQRPQSRFWSGRNHGARAPARRFSHDRLCACARHAADRSITALTCRSRIT